MPKVTEPSFRFWYSPEWYTVQGAEAMYRAAGRDDIASMRAEYTRMRDVAQKRIKRLGEKFPDTKAYQNNAEGFPKLKDLDPRDFAKAFAELAKFVKAKGSTVTGQREIKAKTMKTWQEQGLDLNEKNYDQAIDILEEARKQKIVYGSEKVVSLADATLELNLSKKQTDELLSNLAKTLRHADTLKTSLQGYMEKHDISDAQKVDMDDFITEIGW